MTVAEWMEIARKDAPKLRKLIAEWHPRAHAKGKRQFKREDFEITAPGAESACELIRRSITAVEDGNPLEQFDAAIKSSDFRMLIILLNGAWFGVPESRSCWHITGFSEAVELLENLPEQEGEDGA